LTLNNVKRIPEPPILSFVVIPECSLHDMQRPAGWSTDAGWRIIELYSGTS